MFRRIQIMMFLMALSLCIWKIQSVNAAEKPELFLEDNVLAAGNYNVSLDSSDLSLIIRIEAGGEVVVDEGMAIGYIVPQENIKGWTEVDFDDSGWSGGISGVGYGDGDDNTGVRGSAPAAYTRYYFDVPNVRNIGEITVLTDYDDAYILWLNGVEIARSSNIEAISPVGEIPNWNFPVQGGMAGHEASCIAAGKPNNARWDSGTVERHVIEFDFGGQKPAGSAGKPPEQGSGGGAAPLYLKDNVLAGANFNDGPGSSDMTLIMRLMGDNEIYLDEGSEVKYIHDPDNEDAGDDWIKVEFDDSDWESGISGVGFSDNDDNTMVPAGLISIWTRYYFDAPNADKIKELVLLADYDDTYLAWLNGVLIAFGGGAPAGNPPAWNATQGGSTNRGAAELPAGQPNKARWDNASIEKTKVNFRFAGSSATAVSPKSKLTSTWGSIKKQD